LSKTYVYLRTGFDLNQHPGFNKSVIVVPFVALKMGVCKPGRDGLEGAGKTSRL